MIEQRRTHRESFVGALKEACLMVIPAVLIATALFYLFIFYTDSIPVAGRSQAWEMARFISVAFPALFIPAFTLTGWVQKRSEPTRAEIEQRERAQAARLLAKYPDLRD